MKFFASVVLLLFWFNQFTLAAEAYDQCDNKIDSEKGEKPGKLMGVGYLIVVWGLAEKACGATHLSMVPFIERIIAAEGCGPETEISREMRQSAMKMDKASLAEMLEINDPGLSEEEIRKQAELAAGQFGGCENVLVGRINMEKKYGNKDAN